MNFLAINNLGRHNPKKKGEMEEQKNGFLLNDREEKKKRLIPFWL
jgi:hypothetical protein